MVCTQYRWCILGKRKTPPSQVAGLIVNKKVQCSPMQTASLSMLFPGPATLHSYAPPAAWFTTFPLCFDTSWPCGLYHSIEVGTGPVACPQYTLWLVAPTVSVTFDGESCRRVLPYCRWAPHTAVRKNGRKRSSKDTGLQCVICGASV